MQKETWAPVYRTVPQSNCAGHTAHVVVECGWEHERRSGLRHSARTRSLWRKPKADLGMDVGRARFRQAVCGILCTLKHTHKTLSARLITSCSALQNHTFSVCLVSENASCPCYVMPAASPTRSAAVEPYPALQSTPRWEHRLLEAPSPLLGTPPASTLLSLDSLQELVGVLR